VEKPPSASDFAQLSRDLMADPDEQPTLQTVAERAVAVVPACDFASVSLRRRRRRVETSASTSEVASMCDALQYELDEGPCLEAVWDGDSYLAEDIRHDQRWPRWGPRVADIGVGSVLAIQLTSERETIGALNLYATATHAFRPDDIDLALVYTIHAANALNSARLVSGLQTAVHSRHLIGVAQGILMSTYQLTMTQSFELLRRYSSQDNVKLRDVAEYVVERGGLPESGLSEGGVEADSQPSVEA
jgi:transcriptional regulator with GAF, ATPase, and Fis domain